MNTARRQFLRGACAACAAAWLVPFRTFARTRTEADADCLRDFTTVTDGVPGLRYLQRCGRGARREVHSAAAPRIIEPARFVS